MRFKRSSYGWCSLLFIMGSGAVLAGEPVALQAAEHRFPNRPPDYTYKVHCAGCHDPGEGHPGTMKLGIVRGKQLAVLKGRGDLPVEYIETIVRHGLIEMAPFRKTEIGDAELRALAQWLRTP